MSQAEHKAQAPAAVDCAIITVSDTRTPDNDVGGRTIRELLEGAGHRVLGAVIVRDDPQQVATVIRQQLADGKVRVVITTGGTGITARDDTFEAVDGLLEKRLDGFGELFRMLSYQAIGAAAMLSRACAGLARGHIVIALPGSEPAVRLGMEKLVVPELAHMVQQARTR